MYALQGEGNKFYIDGPPGMKHVAIRTFDKEGKDLYLCPNAKKGKIVAKAGPPQYVFHIPHTKHAASEPGQNVCCTWL